MQGTATDFQKPFLLKALPSGIRLRTFLSLMTVVLICLFDASTSQAQSERKEYLSPTEINQIREAQDINDRVPLYLEFAGIRLAAAKRLAGLESAEKPKEGQKETSKPSTQKPPEAKQEPQKSLGDNLEEYDEIYEEMLRHLDERLDQGEDARKALKAILKESPLHQASLKAIDSKLGDDAPDILIEALSDTSDAIDGAQKTLPGQEQKYKEEKARQKEKARDSRN